MPDQRLLKVLSDRSYRTGSNGPRVFSSPHRSDNCTGPTIAPVRQLHRSDGIAAVRQLQQSDDCSSPTIAVRRLQQSDDCSSASPTIAVGRAEDSRSVSSRTLCVQFAHLESVDRWEKILGPVADRRSQRLLCDYQLTISSSRSSSVEPPLLRPTPLGPSDQMSKSGL